MFQTAGIVVNKSVVVAVIDDVVVAAAVVVAFYAVDQVALSLLIYCKGFD